MSHTDRGLGSRIKDGILQWRIRSLSRRDWRRCYGKIFAQHPEYRKPCDAELEREHRRLWRVLRPDVNLDTLRVCAAISGRCDPDMVPEEVFVSDVQRRLNRYPEVILLANKTITDRWVQKGLMPPTPLHNLDGSFFDAEHHALSANAAAALVDKLTYPVVMKPNLPVESGGGRDVVFFERAADLHRAMAGRANFVVQQRVRQHAFFGRLAGGQGLGLNTVRVCTYRSVTTGQLHLLHGALRMARGGGLDNIGAGGIACFVDNAGRVNAYAVDKYGAKFEAHPDTGIRFDGLNTLPDFEHMKSLALTLAGSLPLVRLASFDLFLDEAGTWRLLEVNLFGHTIGFAQYAGRPFFGPFTREVVDYCRVPPA